MHKDIPVYLDNMENVMNKAFGAFPERLFVLKDNILIYEGGCTPFKYSIPELDHWLERNL